MNSENFSDSPKPKIGSSVLFNDSFGSRRRGVCVNIIECSFVIKDNMDARYYVAPANILSVE